jgi:hypothetical protein
MNFLKHYFLHLELKILFLYKLSALIFVLLIFFKVDASFSSKQDVERQRSATLPLLTMLILEKKDLLSMNLKSLPSEILKRHKKFHKNLVFMSISFRKMMK